MTARHASLASCGLHSEVCWPAFLPFVAAWQARAATALNNVLLPCCRPSPPHILITDRVRTCAGIGGWVGVCVCVSACACSFLASRRGWLGLLVARVCLQSLAVAGPHINFRQVRLSRFTNWASRGFAHARFNRNMQSAASCRPAFFNDVVGLPHLLRRRRVLVRLGLHGSRGCGCAKGRCLLT